MISEEERIKTSLLADDLASLESYIHDLFHFSAIPVCFVSPIGVLLEVNPAFEEISKFKSYDLIGEPIETLFKKEEIEKLTKETFKKGFIKGKEIGFLPKRGKELIVHSFTKVRKDERGDVVGYFLSLFDLTEIKRTEGRLRKEIKRLKEALKKSKKKK